MIRGSAYPAFVVISARDIATRACEIYLARGRADGFDREDWLRAERELKAAPGMVRETGSRAGIATTHRKS